MQCIVVISPQLLQDYLTIESKRIIKNIYKRTVTGIFYRVLTKQHPDNLRRFFLKGNGEIKDFDIPPHITIIDTFEITEEKFAKLNHELSVSIRYFHSFTLHPISIGSYNDTFTIYVNFKADTNIQRLYQSLLTTCKAYMSKDVYEKHKRRSYLPHATILYDDLSPEKIKQAKHMLNQTLFAKPIMVSTVEVWDITMGKRRIIQTYTLINI